MKQQKILTQQNYARIADLYTKDFGNDYEHFDTYFHELNKIIHLRKLTGTIIDLGSGPGNVVDYLLQLKLKNPIAAVDFTPQFCDALKGKYQKEKQVQVICQDFTEYVTQLKANNVAAYIANYSVIHVPDEEIDEMFCDLYMSLQPGGLFIFSVWEGTKKGMEKEPYQTQNDPRVKNIEPLESYMNNFTMDELRARLTQGGFVIQKMERFEPSFLPGEFPRAKIWICAEKNYI